MRKWYCTNCGSTKHCTQEPNSNNCSMELSILRVELEMGKKNYKFKSNYHNWVDAQDYEAREGYLQTPWDVQQKIYEKEDKKRSLNNGFKEKFGRDLFLPNGKLNSNLKSEEKTKTITEELQEIKDSATSFIKTIKSIFSK